MHKILIIDDEKSILDLMKFIWKGQEEYELSFAQSVVEALALLDKNFFDLVLTDLSLGQESGLRVLEYVSKNRPDVPVIMITAFAKTDVVVDAMKLGAYDFIEKPFQVDELKIIVRNALEKVSLRRENEFLKQNQKKSQRLLIGESASMLKVKELIETVSKSDISVLISGESGTGKEVVVRRIHEKSSRKDKALITVNCSAIPEALIESELFGYEKGAFTGANQSKIGLFEAANGGTLFLDELGELPLSLQPKLLRVLAEQAITRVGGTREIPINVRIVSATNRDLEADIEQGKFREDLFYRLNVIRLHLPPLRKRKEDVILLLHHYAQQFSEKYKKTLKGYSTIALEQLLKYEYPGNIRELVNIVEHSVVMSSGEYIELENLPEKVMLQKNLETSYEKISTDEYSQLPSATYSFETDELDSKIDEFEKKIILEALKLSKGSQIKTAQLLKITLRSLRYKLQKHEIVLNQFKI